MMKPKELNLRKRGKIYCCCHLGKRGQECPDRYSVITLACIPTNSLRHVCRTSCGLLTYAEKACLTSIILKNGGYAQTVPAGLC